jgi:energy-coupling factor transporter transmembrane protein EcfT
MSRRIALLLPFLVFLATFGVFIVDRLFNNRTIAVSARGVVTLGVVAVVFLVLTYLAWRYLRGGWQWLGAVGLSAIVIALAAWLVLPYYVDDTDNTTVVARDVRDASEAETPPPPSSSPSAPTPPSTVPGPVRVSRGTLEGVGHSASGEASVIDRGDGSLVVRFETFDIEGTPDPIVYLVPGTDRESTDGGIDLGAMRGNVGDASDYEVPPGAAPGAGEGWTVLVWCGQFAVPIANATQVAA